MLVRTAWPHTRCMHIVVVGAGEVGLYIAQRLSREGHDVVVVDRIADRLRDADERLDVHTVLGSGSDPAVLERAEISKADMLVAVSNDDEVNLVSSLLAKQSDVGTTVVRLQSDALRATAASRLRKAMGVDIVIDPDAETAEEIFELLQFPGASEIFRLSGGEVMIIGARLPSDAPMVGRTLHQLAHEHEPHWDFLIGSLTRRGETIIPRQDLRLEAEDHLRVVCNRRGRQQLVKLLGIDREVPRRVMLLGGGHTARILAERLERRGAQVVVVERKESRAAELAERLDRTLVIRGEITDADLLAEEEVGRSDVVIALTGEDDANILACLFAKASGAKETIAVVHRLSLLNLVHQSGIDVALSPRTAIANAVLRFVRGGGISSVTTFLESEAEILEMDVREGSLADGALVAELPLPKDVLIGAIVRDGNAEIVRGRTKLRDQDRVIAFAMPSSVGAVKRIFG